MDELVFEIMQEGDGGLVGDCLTEPIFTQADTWAELRSNVREAVAAFYDGAESPATIRLHLVRDEVLPTGCEREGNSRAIDVAETIPHKRTCYASPKCSCAT